MSMPSLASTPIWEKIVGLLGIVLILTTVGFLLWSALEQKNGSPPDIEAEVKDITLVSSGYLVRVTVHNRGDQTAESLDMEARLKSLGNQSEQATVTVDYLAPRSSQEVGFYFTLDPSSGELAFRPLGFQVP